MARAGAKDRNKNKGGRKSRGGSKPEETEPEASTPDPETEPDEELDGPASDPDGGAKSEEADSGSDEPERETDPLLVTDNEDDDGYDDDEESVEDLKARLAEAERERDDALDDLKEAVGPTVADDEPEDEEDDTPEQAAMRRRKYWIGSLNGAPYHNHSFGGVGFPAVTEKVVHPPGAMKTKRTPRRGGIIELNAEEFAKIKSAAKREIVRTAGRKKIVLNTANEHYRPERGDVPIGRFYFCIAVADAAKKFGAMWVDKEPPPLA